MALIVITQRSVGEQLTAAKYNADRQEIVDAIAPATIEDYSVNEAQMQIVTDPGEPGSPSLAGTLAGEFERLRYILKEMKGTNHWYTSNATRKMALSWRGPLVTWAASGTTSNFCELIIPDGWVANTNITFSYFAAASSGAGTAVMYYTYYIFRDGQAISSPGNTAANFAPGDTNYHLRSHTLVGSGLTASDGVVVEVTRLGSDAGDTNTNIITPQSVYISYTGIASR